MTEADPIAISLGPISLLLDANGSFARAVGVTGEEVFRGIGFVVRDANWGTPHLPATADVIRSADEARASAAGHLTVEGEDLDWSVDWTLLPGKLIGRCRVTSDTGFSTNRTGFVVLHSLGAARGRDVAVGHSDGSTEATRFPDLVSPHQPFFDITGLDYETPAGTAVSIRFLGEIFEIEDQRNWTDASYKTYCRPLGLPYPYRIEPGETVEQIVEIALIPAAGAVAASAAPATPTVGATAALPVLGTGLPPGRPAAGTEEALARLSLGFTGIEIALDEPGAIEAAREAIEAAPGAVRLDIRKADAAPTLAALAALRPALEGRAVVGVSLWDGDDALVAEARALLPGAPIGGGTGAFFTELNRMTSWPAADYLTWTSNPTVHGSDDDTIGETTEPLSDILRTARAKLPVKRFQIGPMTLGLRFNPNATTPEGRRRASPPDMRQGGPIAAAWLGATLAGFHGGDIAALSFFQPVGPKGLVDEAGRITESGHLLSRLARHPQRPATILRWAHAPRAAGILLDGGEARELVLVHAKHAAAPLPLPEGDWRVVEDLTPDGFVIRARGRVTEVELVGFAVAWLTE